MEVKIERRGGARPGAGRKRKLPDPPVVAKKKATDPDVVDGDIEPKEFLRRVMLGQIDASSSQHSAAKGLMAYVHKKAEEEGKKAAAAKKATETTNRFGAPVPPGRPAPKAA